MTAVTIYHDDQAAQLRIDPTMPGYVADDAAFRAAVQEGIASAEAGPCIDLATLEAELREIIHGKG